MTPSQLEFNLAVREWANEACLGLVPSGADEKLVLKYADLNKNQSLNEEQLEELRRDLSLKVKEMACRHDADIEIEFTDLGFGELGLIIYIKEPPGREEAKEEYYDLLYMGARRTDEQHLRLQILIKKYGFR